MGVLGLRKWLEGCTSCNTTTRPKDTAPKDHVMLDLNGVIHMAFPHGPKATPGAAIAAVLVAVKQLMKHFVPQKSVFVAIDGPAPFAKIVTQRHRRARHVLDSDKAAFSELMITTGSTFMLDVEDAVVKCLAELFPSVAVTCSGSLVPGEGELKISGQLSALRTAASTTVDDTVVIVGNDSDLALVALAATHFHNIFIVNPKSMSVVSVPDLLLHWLQSRHSPLPAKYLPSIRMDFIFIFLLNGGDHYNGLTDAALHLWGKYRHLRSSGRCYHRSIVKDNFALDMDFLQVLLKDNKQQGKKGALKGKEKRNARYEKGVSAKDGAALLEGVVWSLVSVATGVCPDYGYMPGESSPTLGSLRRAASQVAQVDIPFSNTAPLRPIEVFAALAPHTHCLPAAVASAVLGSEEHKKLLDKRAARTVVKAVRALFQDVDETALTTAEKRCCAFGVPYTVTGRERQVQPSHVDPAADSRTRFVFEPFQYERAGVAQLRFVDAFPTSKNAALTMDIIKGGGGPAKAQSEGPDPSSSEEEEEAEEADEAVEATPKGVLAKACEVA